MITIVSKKIVSKESYHKSELESSERKYLFLIIIRNLSNIHRGFTIYNQIYSAAKSIV